MSLRGSALKWRAKRYHAQPFPSDAKRVEFLFELYEKYTAGLLVGPKPKRNPKAAR